MSFWREPLCCKAVLSTFCVSHVLMIFWIRHGRGSLHLLHLFGIKTRAACLSTLSSCTNKSMACISLLWLADEERSAKVSSGVTSCLFPLSWYETSSYHLVGYKKIREVFWKRFWERLRSVQTIRFHLLILASQQPHQVFNAFLC